LDNLLRALVSTRILLKGCGGKEWRKAALILSLPPPDNQLEKYSGSRFALLIRELGWSFDMVQYALGDGGTKDLIFEWRDERGRYVLQGNLLQTGVAIDEMESLQEDNDREALDRQHLLTYLENSSILKGNAFSPLAWRRFWYTFPRGKFAAAFKKIHKGEWLGLEVAIATIWNVPKEDVEREAGFMVTVHHPNVVDFFGCAFKKEDNSAQENPWTAFLVMELMEEDLGRLIARVTTDPLAVRRPDSGSPFSLSVTVDILIQIVEAMIHSHKHKVMHRDLKTNNCLVSKKSAPQSDVDAYYRVKVIDFGISTIWDSERDIHTARRGTARFMAPEVSNGGDYTCSADVYSFGMVCYEVITGSPPFNHLLKNEDVFNLVRTGERPPIPGTCPQSLNSLMTKCWAPEPSLRPTFEAIRKDLWDFKLLIELQIHA
jgi:serine/threonine protein kinase